MQLPLKIEVDEPTRAAVEAMCNQQGARRAAKALGMSLDSVLRVVARQPIRKGTVLVLREALAALARKGGR